MGVARGAVEEEVTNGQLSLFHQSTTSSLDSQLPLNVKIFENTQSSEEEPFEKRYKSENTKSGSSSTLSGVVFSKSADHHLIKALPLWKVEQQESKLQKGKENFISQKIKHFSLCGYLSNA